MADHADEVVVPDPLAGASLRIVRNRALGELERRLFGRTPKRLRLGRYVLGEQIGSGGFGSVYRAHDPKLARDVAIKILRSQGLAPDARALLLDESRALAALNHPNVIRIYDVGAVGAGELGPDRGEEMFLVLELVEGQTLRTWLKTRRQNPEEILRRLAMAGRGLAAAHHAGIAHLDFKPANVLVDGHGVARVLDFGLSRYLRVVLSTDELDTIPIAQASEDGEPKVAGTPAYMAPETHQGQPPTFAADQYALALVAVEAFRGKYPFEARTREGLLARKLGGVTAAQLLSFGVPRRLTRVLSRALSPAPEDRFPSLDPLVRAFQPPRRSRTGWLAAGALVAATSAAWATLHRDDDPACDRFVRRARVNWEAKAPAIARRFEQSSADYAEALHERFVAKVDTKVLRWTEQATALCAGPSVDDAAQRTRTETCLAERAAELEATLQTVATGTTEALARSVDILSIVGDPAACAAERAEATALVAPENKRRARALRAMLVEGRALSAAGVYDQAETRARGVLDALREAPIAAVRAEATYELGNALMGRSRPRDAADAHESAYLQANAIGHDRISAAAAIRMVSVASRQLSNNELAVRWAALAESAVVRLGGPPTVRASLTYASGMLAHRQGKLDLAEERYAAALALYRAAGDDRSAAACLGGLSDIRRSQRRPQEALAMIEEALQLRADALGERHPDTTLLLGSVALVQRELGSLGAARATLTEVLVRQRAALGERSPSVATVLINLGGIDYALGDLEACLQHQRLAAEILAEQLGEEAPFHAIALDNIGAVLRDLGRPTEALQHHERAHKIQQLALPEDHPQLATTLGNIGAAAALTGDRARASAALDDALARAERAWGADHVNLAEVRLQRGRAFEHLGGDGRSELRDAVRRLEETPPAAVRADAIQALARAEQRHGTAPAEVRQLVERARAMYTLLGHQRGLDQLATFDVLD